jgi:hypothetical protein
MADDGEADAALPAPVPPKQRVEFTRGGPRMKI